MKWNEILLRAAFLLLLFKWCLFFILPASIELRWSHTESQLTGSEVGDEVFLMWTDGWTGKRWRTKSFIPDISDGKTRRWCDETQLTNISGHMQHQRQHDSAGSHSAKCAYVCVCALIAARVSVFTADVTWSSQLQFNSSDIFGSKVKPIRGKKKRCHVLNLVLNVICLYSIFICSSLFHFNHFSWALQIQFENQSQIFHDADPIYVQIKFKNKQNQNTNITF